MNFKTKTESFIADTLTPVKAYMSLRKKYKNCIMLESSDYDSKKNNSLSFICFEPQISFRISDDTAIVKCKGESLWSKAVNSENFTRIFADFKKEINITEGSSVAYNGLFGYAAYNAVSYFENIKLSSQKKAASQIPSMIFSFYKYVLVFRHFSNSLILIENRQEAENSEIDKVKEKLFEDDRTARNDFKTVGEEHSNLTDEQYKEMVSRGKHHCRRGDVFQIVLSRQFKQKFKGEDLNVYRVLRSINPSPYLFYYDFGDFRLFGSSPEAQIKISDGKAIINPIAGTYKRTGNPLKDEALANKLLSDKKENAEHVMLVDLARNDLSRNSKNVSVKTFKEVQYFSHVIHLVSEVEGDYSGDAIRIAADTFPAGTLSGAPKYKAMQLIDQYENQDRGFYGGAVGYIGLDNNINLAIAIRSFVSKNKTLYYQAGAGIVVSSDENSELQEVNNKLSALTKAIKKAGTEFFY